jgi:S-adenosylmethionine:tRNA ribosyltransferase-isomerase
MYRDGKSLPEFFRFDDPYDASTPMIAIGTTAVKALESFSNVPNVTIEGNEGTSELLITPGHTFRNVKGILTNFHYPKEPLMALVAAFMGVEQIMEVYKYAVDYGIRFIDFGDRLLVI